MWKRHGTAFKAKMALEAAKGEKDEEKLRSELYQQIVQLKVELDWLKRKSQILRISDKIS